MTRDASAVSEDVTIRRLCDLDEWEFYRIVQDGTEHEAYSIALRSHTELRQVEYEVWGDGEEEPRDSGSVAHEDAGEQWPEAARRRLLRVILHGHVSRRAKNAE